MTATGPPSTSGTCHVSFVIIIVTIIMTTLYTRHIYFMDLAKYGCDVKYINMVSDRMSRVTCVTRVTCNVQVRNPLRRFVSRYHFNREVTNAAKAVKMKHQ